MENQFNNLASKLMENGLKNLPPLPPLEIAGQKIDLNDPTLKKVAGEAIDKIKNIDVNNMFKQGEAMLKMFQK